MANRFTIASITSGFEKRMNLITAAARRVRKHVSEPTRRARNIAPALKSIIPKNDTGDYADCTVPISSETTRIGALVEVLVSIKEAIKSLKTERQALRRADREHLKAEGVILASYDDAEDAEYFIKALNVLSRDGLIGIEKGLYDWPGTIADFKRLCDVYGFNSWASLDRCILHKGHYFNSGSAKTQLASRDENLSALFKKIIKCLTENDLYFDKI